MAGSGELACEFSEICINSSHIPTHNSGEQIYKPTVENVAKSDDAQFLLLNIK